MVNANRVNIEEADNENNYIEGSLFVMKTNAIAMIKDCGLFYQNLFEELPPWFKRMYGKMLPSLCFPF